MAKLPTYEEMGKKVAEEALDEIYGGKTIREWIEILVKQQPFVIPQPKTGEWIDDRCSECGKGIEDLIDSREWYENEQPNFCPFCGIKIQEVGKWQ